jgi:transcriptional antiterminator
MLTKRQKELLELLESRDDFLTVQFIANKLGVSKPVRRLYSKFR